ncbi:MAG: PsbP-related protein [Candidatus Daviesbacteria bacterium]|nr:PsbP-related protein [Candidatus Daviesbacteria bacterium]
MQKGFLTLSERSESKGFAPILIIILIALAVGGYLLYQKQVKPVATPQPVIQPTSVPTISPSATDSAETANWKTYTNSKYGFSFKYPQDYAIKEESERVFYIKNKENNVFALWIYDNPNNLSLKDYESKNTNEKTGFGPFVYYPNAESVKFQNLDAYYTNEEITCLSKCGSYIWITKDKIYKLTGSSKNKPDQILDEILSTFRFAN